MDTLNMTFSIIYAVVFVGGATVEVIGARRKAKGDTITENWRWVDKWLALHSPIADWFWRVMSAGVLVWVVIHLPGVW